jgi:hypothetical protein
MSLEVLRLLKVRATLEPAFREQLIMISFCLDRSMPVAVY